MIPKNITKEHILIAMQTIDKEGIPKERNSTHYYVKHNERYYPPKYVISLAYKCIEGYEWDLTRFHGGAESNKFLSKLGFEIECFKKPLTFSMPKKDKIYSNSIEHEDECLDEYDEGNKEIKEHIVRERNKVLIENAKKLFKIRNNNKLYCEICGFDFFERYGKRGKDFIECHHIKPISQMDEKEKTNINDLIMVCSNCHSMIHRKKPWLSKEELKLLLVK